MEFIPRLVWGSFVWNMFDFAADHCDEGDRPGINDKGLVTHDRAVRKDAFFFYKASWVDTPVVHITSRRFSPRPSGLATVKVYSIAASVNLARNGQSPGAGRREGNGMKRGDEVEGVTAVEQQVYDLLMARGIPHAWGVCRLKAKLSEAGTGQNQ